MESTTETESIVRWLASPQAYAPTPERVERVETHISQLFLCGPLVYKLKKPLKFSFLDFSTVEAREHACREEVRLNRRLAADWYLGVVSITRDPLGDFQMDGEGEVVDWLVEMRRLPVEMTMDALLQRGELDGEHIQRLVDRLVVFHKSLSPVPLQAQDYIERYRTNVRGNLCELQAVEHGLSHSVVGRVHGFQLQLLRLWPGLFEQRVRSGRVVDGHGDLRPEHICFTDPIAIFDCIEFNADLRCIDTADELAFLSAECDFLGANWVGPKLLAGCQAASGDQPASILFHFYKSYRSCVRAKVAALRADQLQGAARDKATKESQRHMALADASVQPWLRPLIIVVGGAAGTGKSTLAASLADSLGAQLLRTDIIRREIFGPGTHTAQTDSGIYSPQARARVYQEILGHAQSLHAEQMSVILDGTFSTVESLRATQNLAIHRKSIFLAIQCVCRPEVARARIGERLAGGYDASDARPELHELQRMRWQAWPDDVRQIQIDTELPVIQQVDQVVENLCS